MGISRRPFRACDDADSLSSPLRLNFTRTKKKGGSIQTWKSSIHVPQHKLLLKSVGQLARSASEANGPQKAEIPD